MDVIISAATPAEWWIMVKLCGVLAVFFAIGALVEGPLARMWRRYQRMKFQDWRQVPPPNWRSSRGGREYW